MTAGVLCVLGWVCPVHRKAADKSRLCVTRIVVVCQHRSALLSQQQVHDAIAVPRALLCL